MSCSEPSLEDDAKQAANLMNQSNQYAMDNEVSKAGRVYTEAQEIIKKYRHKPDFDKFYEIYSSYLEIGISEAMESEIEKDSSYGK